MAREGRYPIAIENDVSEDRLHRFFAREGDHYRVRQELRDIVLFAAHDVLKDPPFSRVDLISCRNLLIYLDRELQEQVCSIFHYALNPGGFLFLGPSEGADSPPGLFRCLDRTARIYQSIAVAGEKRRLPPHLLGSIGGREPVVHVGRGLTPAMALQEAVLHRRAIEQVAPPSMLVDESHRVVHLSENASRYLLPAGGPLSSDAVDLVRPELRFELRSALNRAFEQQLPTCSLSILVRFNGAAHRVHLLVKPLQQNGPAEPANAVVMFIEGEAVDETLAAPDRQPSDETVRRLTQELELTQRRLHTVREESDVANEELRAANEELQSINEEYRSTSEELETSKEELQSINEELQTVNSELKLKLEAISRAHSDLQNLVAAADFGTLFLDANLRIKRFTDRVTELFSVTPSDEGRPITDFVHQLEYNDLIKDARAVLADLTPIRREVRSRNGRWYDVRLRPYRTADDKIDGVVITFVENSEQHQIEEALRRNEELLRQQKRLVDMSRDPIFVWDFDGGIVDWNRGSEELYGYSRDEALGKQKQQLLGTTVPGSSFAELKAKLLRAGNWAGELRQKTRSGEELTIESRLQLQSLDGRRLVLEAPATSPHAGPPSAACACSSANSLIASATRWRSFKRWRAIPCATANRRKTSSNASKAAWRRSRALIRFWSGRIGRAPISRSSHASRWRPMSPTRPTVCVCRAKPLYCPPTLPRPSGRSCTSLPPIRPNTARCRFRPARSGLLGKPVRGTTRASSKSYGTKKARGSVRRPRQRQMRSSAASFPARMSSAKSRPDGFFCTIELTLLEPTDKDAANLS